MAKLKGFSAMMKKKIMRKKEQESEAKAKKTGAVPAWMKKLSGGEKEKAIRVHKMQKAIKKRKKDKTF